MNERLEQYLSQKTQEQQAINERQKRDLLLREGLYDVQYLDEWSAEASYDNDSGKYIIQVPIQITDEEYRLLREICKSENNESDEEDIDNGIAKALTVIAWIIYIVGFIAGIGSGIDAAEYYSEFNFIVALIYWVVALISGTMFLGFAEIIKLLEAIKRKG